MDCPAADRWATTGSRWAAREGRQRTASSRWAEGASLRPERRVRSVRSNWLSGRLSSGSSEATLSRIVRSLKLRPPPKERRVRPEVLMWCYCPLHVALSQSGPGHGLGTPDPHPHRHPPGRFAGDRGWRSHPRFAAGDRGSIPTAIPDLPESGIQLSTIEYCKGVESRFRLPQCLTLGLIVLPKLINLRRSAMSDSDDAADYSGTSDSDSESDKVPSRLPARAESRIFAHDLSVLHAGFGCAPSSPE